ncbi:hypothetical protein RLON56S_00265 [Alishewanella longhuensis]
MGDPEGSARGGLVGSVSDPEGSGSNPDTERLRDRSFTN